MATFKVDVHNSPEVCEGAEKKVRILNLALTPHFCQTACICYFLSYA